MIAGKSGEFSLSVGDIELAAASNVSQDKDSGSRSENEARSPVIRIQDIEDEEDKVPNQGRPSLYDNL